MDGKAKSGAYYRISANFTHLIPSEKRLAEYISKNKEKLEYLTINDLANEVGVSPSTVNRFCKHLDYAGFKDFKLSAIKDLHGLKDTWSEIKIEKEDEIENIISKACQANSNACLGTELLLDPKDLDQTVKLLFAAKRVLIYGDGAVATVAVDFYQKMLRVGLDCIYNLDERFQKLQAALSTQDEVAIIFDLSGSTKGPNEIAAAYQKSGTKVITVCNTIGSPLCKYGTVNLFAPGRMTSDITCTRAPRIALLCVVDCIFSLMLQRLEPKHVDALIKTRQVIVDGWIS
ncbi:MAG: MurR/RpiR family transcriptional regulator [Clostridia bacterium]